jgi:DNA replicative helicase MCM subunit Mcm2 (Cdc46/Mcm family)
MLLLHTETNNAPELPFSQQTVAIAAAVIIAALQLRCLVPCS